MDTQVVNGPSAAVGGANRPTIVVENSVGALEAALATARELSKTQFFYDQVDRMRIKLAKANDRVLRVEAQLADAEAQLVAEQARVADVEAEAARVAAMPPAERAEFLSARSGADRAARAERREREAAERAAIKAARQAVETSIEVVED